MKTKSKVLLSLGLTGLMGFTMHMRQSPHTHRSIASVETQSIEKAPSEREKLALIKKDLDDKKARLVVVEQLLVDYSKEEEATCNPDECKNEKADALKEQSELKIAIADLDKKYLEQEPCAKEEQDKEDEDKRIAKEKADKEEEAAKIAEEKKKLQEEKDLLAKEKEKLKEEKDIFACEKDKSQPTMMNTFFAQLVQQQQMIISMQTMVQQMMFTQMIERQFSLVNRIDHMDIGQGDLGQRNYSLNSVLGLTQNMFYMPTINGLPINNGQAASTQEDPNNNVSTSWSQGIPMNNVIPSESVFDASRNPMYSPLFSGFQDAASGLPGGISIPYQFSPNT